MSIHIFIGEEETLVGTISNSKKFVIFPNEVAPTVEDIVNCIEKENKYTTEPNYKFEKNQIIELIISSI
jgi:hypothetical protein